MTCGLPHHFWDEGEAWVKLEIFMDMNIVKAVKATVFN